MKMKKTSLNTTKVTDRKIKHLYLVAATVVAAAFVMAMPAFADDPLTTINNLSDFCVQRHQSHRRNPAGVRHRANRPCPQRPRCQPAGARFYDVFWRRSHLLCKGHFGYDSVSDAASLTFMLNKRIMFSVKVNSREGVCYGFYNEDYRVGFPK